MTLVAVNAPYRFRVGKPSPKFLRVELVMGQGGIYHGLRTRAQCEYATWLGKARYAWAREHRLTPVYVIPGKDPEQNDITGAHGEVSVAAAEGLRLASELGHLNRADVGDWYVKATRTKNRSLEVSEAQLLRTPPAAKFLHVRVNLDSGSFSISGWAYAADLDAQPSIKGPIGLYRTIPTASLRPYSPRVAEAAA